MTGEFITEVEAKKRNNDYEKKNSGCFIYYGVNDIFGKSKW